MLRIIAGIYGGRIIRAPKGERTRPTSMRVREALFSILQPDIQDAVFIDLFAGSGAVGIEALSRGAAAVLFSDSNKACGKLITENLRGLGIVAAPESSIRDVSFAHQVLFAHRDLANESGIDSLRQPLASLGATKTNIVFADPPYALPIIRLLPEWLSMSGLLKNNATVVIEHSAGQTMPDKAMVGFGDLRFFKTKRYGDTSLSIYCMGEKT